MRYIRRYPRAQAIRDGALVDVSELALEAGIRIPVAITQRLLTDVITPHPKAVGQSINGRLWDALFLLQIEIRNSQFQVTSLPFSFGYQCIFVIGEKEQKLTRLKAVLAYGDDLKPALTIKLQDEEE
ncbi:conserved hypothetical protein [Brevibacillus sp. IT-7CA2]|uniref:DUF6573 family protein n=1 Tax=Brevibacillus sp. IT-7CA2 TaxID=3026436 RepID=UPI0039E1B3C9